MPPRCTASLWVTSLGTRIQCGGTLSLACPTLSDCTSFRSVQPTQGDKVDVLYYVQGHRAYFRGTVLRVITGAEPPVSIRFRHQTHYGVTFPQETTDILTSWLCGTDKLTSYFIRYPSYIRRRHTSYATLHTYADRHTSYAVLHTSTSNFILHLSYTIRVLPYCCCDRHAAAAMMDLA